MWPPRPPLPQASCRCRQPSLTPLAITSHHCVPDSVHAVPSRESGEPVLPISFAPGEACSAPFVHLSLIQLHVLAVVQPVLRTFRHIQFSINFVFLKKCPPGPLTCSSLALGRHPRTTGSRPPGSHLLGLPYPWATAPLGPIPRGPPPPSVPHLPSLPRWLRKPRGTSPSPGVLKFHSDVPQCESFIHCTGDRGPLI